MGDLDLQAQYDSAMRLCKSADAEIERLGIANERLRNAVYRLVADLAATNAALTSVSDLLDEARVERDEARAAYVRAEADRDDWRDRFQDAAEKADMYREQRNEAIAVTARLRAKVAEEIAEAIEADPGNALYLGRTTDYYAAVARQHATAPTETKVPKVPRLTDAQLEASDWDRDDAVQTRRADR